MKKRINLTYLFFLLVFSFVSKQNACAQLSKEDKLDSLRAKFVKDSSRIYRQKEVAFLVAIDKRNTFIHTETKTPVEVSGGQIGMSIDGKHNLGLGFYAMSAKHSIVEEKRKETIKLSMGYATIFWEYTFVNTRFWEIGAPMEIGAGSYQTLITYDSTQKRVPEFKDTTKHGILLLGAGLNVDFKIFRWIGVNAMGGYRLVGGNEPNKVNFNGVFYSVGMHFYFGELWKMFKLHEKRGGYGHNVSMIKNPPPWN